MAGFSVQRMLYHVLGASFLVISSGVLDTVASSWSPVLDVHPQEEFDRNPLLQSTLNCSLLSPDTGLIYGEPFLLGVNLLYR